MATNFNRMTAKGIALILVLAASIALSACGRRGALQPPPSSRVMTTDENGKEVEVKQEKVDQPFILDPLL